MTGLLAKQELIAAKIDPEQYSPAAARRLVRRELRFQSAGKEQLDVSEFQWAVKDSYKRTSRKKARHDQRKKREPPPKVPNISMASDEQRESAKNFNKPQTQAV